MKKSIAILVLLSFGLVFTTPVSAQKAYKFPKNQNLDKISVKYKSIDAFSDGNGVWLAWETAYESSNLGFNIYRSNGNDKEIISSNLIPGNYLKTGDAQTGGDKYSFFDADGDNNSAYYIETFSINGQKQISELISPQYVSDLTPFAGNSSAFLKKTSKRADSSILTSESDLPTDLKSEVNQNTGQADAVTQRLVAAQPGVKIGVKKEGFYRVTRAELQNGGFDVSSPWANWQLYKNGVEQAINIGANGDYIEFYGKGLDNRDTDTQIYFLIAGAQNGKRIAAAVRSAIGRKVVANSYSQTTTYKERTIYSSDTHNGDVEDNFFGRVINNDSTMPATINLNLPSIDFSSSVSSFDLKIQGVTQVLHQVKVVLNGVEVGVIDGSYETSTTQHFDIQTSILREGNNTLVLTSQNGSSDISFFDTIKVNYQKRYLVQQNQLSFYVPNYKAVYLDGFTSPNIRVFDITYPDQPRIISYLTPEANNSGGYRVYLPSSRARVLFAIEDSALLSVASININAPSSLSTSAHNADMIIISYKDWMSEANDWANYRRSQGMTVEVVNIEDVYDEFSFGNFSTDAIRGFLQYAYNNWGKQPGYVLLIGDATYNPRNYPDGRPNSGAYNFVPTKIVETNYIETGSDETMADFNDDGLAEIPIGRLPIHDGQTVTKILNKVSIFEQNIAPQNLSRGVVFASDVPNGYDFQGVSNRLRSQLSPDVTSIMVNKSESDSRTHLLSELNNGRFLVNYSGHGNTGAWSASPTFFGTSDVANMTNGNNLSIFTMLTCLNGFFIQPEVTLSDALLEKQSGGAAAVWASTGLTTPDVQEIMATRFFNEINTSGASMRLGDIIKNAKAAIPAGRDVRLSWALIGDPALKVK